MVQIIRELKLICSVCVCLYVRKGFVSKIQPAAFTWMFDKIH